MNRFILCIAVAAIVLPASANAQFRVLPYQQQPAEDGMLFTWFTENDVQGQLVVTGGGLKTPLAFYSTPELAELLTYREPELNDAVSRGYPILADDNYKHSVQVTGLLANTTYTYTVTQGSGTFSATFTTAPSMSDWQDIRAAILSDSETEPRGAVQIRDWTEDGRIRPEPAHHRRARPGHDHHAGRSRAGRRLSVRLGRVLPAQRR